MCDTPLDITVEYPRYKYGYSVHDPKTKDIKSAWEHRDGDVTHGEYSLVEPDGAIRIVKYTVNKNEGFRAVVDRIPPPQSSKDSMSFGPNFSSEKSSFGAFNDDKFQSYYNPPARNYEFNKGHYQVPNVKDFHLQNQKQFSPPSTEFQDFSAELKNNKNPSFQFFSQQKEESEEDEDDSEEEEGDDEDGKENEDEKENIVKQVAPVQTDVPRYNFQSHNLPDVSDQYKIPPFDFNEALNKPYQNFNQNQQRAGFGFTPVQPPFRASQRDFSQPGFQELVVRPNPPTLQYNTGLISPVAYFQQPATGKTASYQSINYNTPTELSHTVIHNPNQHNNVQPSPLQQLQPQDINMAKHLPYYGDTYYSAPNGNYKYSQPEVQTPVGKVLQSLNTPPAHSFPSTSHLLIPPKEKLPNYNENQNAQINLPPPGTPISHSHHHEGEFDRYD
ncbi:apoptotic chromatin condensation inducer in the nucleus-like [Diaphorina citri]|uniref:Apoptotic chromatin condensation inducer in the nucleus-like n=1 Tax=Diaphorina citri TaxID=121845 RepID=A0A3Q0ITP5_DIACI|nr:apoptotic chromatin condensation inducer in the nucleus-like [Diaphorina citri]